MAAPPLGTDPRHAVPPSGRTSWLLVVAVRAGGHDVAILVGEADLHTADQLRQQLVALLPADAGPLLVDLGALDFCDLRGLDALRDVEQVARSRGVHVTYRGVSRRLAWLSHSFAVQRGRESGTAPAQRSRPAALTPPRPRPTPA